jgi:hypothetical protein
MTISAALVSLTLCRKAVVIISRMNERALRAQRMGEERIYVLYRMGRERIRPEGCVMTFVARGMRVQKRVCHDTSATEDEEDEAGGRQVRS